MEDEYLKLFSQINGGSNPEKKTELMPDKADYSQFENLSKPKQIQYENLNETPDLSRYQINENLNDGWNIDFQFETRINGERISSSTAPAPSFRKRQQMDDPNGLNKYLGNLNEVYQVEEMQAIKEVVSHTDLTGPTIFESLNEVAVVSVELFEKINSKAFIGLASTVDVHKLQGGV